MDAGHGPGRRRYRLLAQADPVGAQGCCVGCSSERGQGCRRHPAGRRPGPRHSQRVADRVQRGHLLLGQGYPQRHDATAQAGRPGAGGRHDGPAPGEGQRADGRCGREPPGGKQTVRQAQPDRGAPAGVGPRHLAGVVLRVHRGIAGVYAVRYLSVCSGIEAATQAWHPLGWKPVAFSEIEKFPSAVLAHHYPDVPNWGDMTKFKEWPDEQIDLLVGGTPCQSFSVAGLRKGLDDPRGNLALTYCAIADRYKPRWLVWENVPGVLSADKGRAFGSILGAMAELGYGWAYRILDAQYVRTRRFRRAVPQRRRRVFVVAHLGDWRRAAAVLFDAESLRGNPPPGREAGETTAHDASPCIGASGRGFERAGETRGQDPVVAAPLTSGAPSGTPEHGARSGTAK